MTTPQVRHAGLIAVRQAGFWRGALIEGQSGVGKSDLAIRAITAGWRLVADDRTVVFVSGGRLFGRAPPALAGLLEMWGLGVRPVPALRLCEIALLVRCHASGTGERHPDPDFARILDVPIPAIDLRAADASAPAKLSQAIEHLGQKRQQGYQAPPRLCRGG